MFNFYRGVLPPDFSSAIAISTIQELEIAMLKAAGDLKFEKAARSATKIKELKHMLDGTKSEAKPVSYQKSKRMRK